MNVDYNDEIIKYVSKLKDANEYIEVINDYNNIKTISNSILSKDMISYVYSIRNKYNQEINIISNIRINYYSNIGKSTIEEVLNNIYSEISFLLEYLPRILIYRVNKNHFKELVKDDIISNLYCKDSKTAFEVVSKLIK